MIIFRRKVKGLILLIIGFYLFAGNTTFSILFNRVTAPCIPNPYGPDCIPLDPINYITVWITLYGWYTILIALGGLIIIFIGSRYFIIIKKLDNSEKIAH